MLATATAGEHQLVHIELVESREGLSPPAIRVRVRTSTAASDLIVSRVRRERRLRRGRRRR